MIAELHLEPAADFFGLLLLALVQGLTEFLPVSSSGHLVLVGAALSLEEPGIVIDVALHLGTLLAVLVVYRRDLLRLVRDLFAGRVQQLLYLAVGTLPAAVVGLAFRDQFEAAFTDPRKAAWGLLATAVVLSAGERARRARLRQADAGAALASADAPAKRATKLDLRAALWIGCAQAAAIWPGVSRSGSTITAALLLGIPAKEAARFSFLLSIPVIGGAALLALPEVGESGSTVSTAQVVWAVLFAGLVGWGALRMLLAFLGRGAFAWFGAYCAVLGIGVLAFS